MWSKVSAITAGLSLNSYIAILGSTFLCLAAASAVASDAVMLPGGDEIIATDTAVIDVAAVADIETLLERLADKRVVFVGESHDRYEDHLNQLAIIAGLQAQGKDLAIGMEFFQQPFQPHLDAFVAGELDEADFLRQTEYFERWRFDYRLYRPILRFARDNRIPIVALNLEKEITDQVGDGGIASLSADQSSRIPADIDRDDEDYRNHVKAVFDMHPKGDDAVFEHFLDVQLLWDEGMAERAARYLEANPGKTLVVLAGAGHVEYGRGIPARVQRRLPVPSATVINGTLRPFDPDAGGLHPVSAPGRTSRYRPTRGDARYRIRGRGHRCAGLCRDQRREDRGCRRR